MTVGDIGVGYFAKCCDPRFGPLDPPDGMLHAVICGEVVERRTALSGRRQLLHFASGRYVRNTGSAWASSVST